MNEFLHRAIGIPKTQEAGDDVITVALTEEIHHALLLAKDDVGDIALTCKEDVGDFKAGKNYAVCSIAMRGMCIVDGDQSHESIPREAVERYFALRLTRSRLAAIRGLAAAAQSERADRLRGLVARFLDAGTFRVGDEVRWKDGLRNKIRPLIGEIGVVVEVRDVPSSESGDPGSSDAGAKLDVVVAVLDEDGDLMHFPLDSRRLELAS